MPLSANAIANLRKANMSTPVSQTKQQSKQQSSTVSQTKQQSKQQSSTVSQTKQQSLTLTNQNLLVSRILLKIADLIAVWSVIQVLTYWLFSNLRLRWHLEARLYQYIQVLFLLPLFLLILTIFLTNFFYC